MKSSENLKRVIVSVIAIPIILIACYLGGYYFFMFVALISLMSFYEFSILVRSKGSKSNIYLGELLIIVLLFNQLKPFINPVVIIVIFSIIVLVTELFRNNGSPIHNLGATFLGVIYIGVFSASFIALREFYPPDQDSYVNGAYLVISILAAIWIGDSAAYYGGTALGGHKLFPRVSPKKSWEGAIIGFAFTILAMILAKILVLSFLTWKDIIVIGILIGVLGQLGDLVESLIKRDSEVKDSSSLIPGHGGFLDRFDSLLLSAPAIWVYLFYFS